VIDAPSCPTAQCHLPRSRRPHFSCRILSQHTKLWPLIIRLYILKNRVNANISGACWITGLLPVIWLKGLSKQISPHFLLATEALRYRYHFGKSSFTDRFWVRINLVVPPSMISHSAIFRIVYQWLWLLCSWTLSIVLSLSKNKTVFR
jgi:hypothetical protein